MTCSYCKTNPTWEQRTETKHCTYCHETYEEWMPHIRQCVNFNAHWEQQTGHPLKPEDSSKKK